LSSVVVRGSAYDGGHPFGLYLIAFYGQSLDDKIAHSAVALLDRTAAEPHPLAAAIVVPERRQQFDCQFVSWSESPWREEAYPGEMLEPDAARRNPHRDLICAVVDRVIEDLPDVQSYFS
jgi:hypothetical protein